MKFLVQDGEYIKKPTIDGLETIRSGEVKKEDFENHGTSDLSDILGHFSKSVDMIFHKDLDDKKIYKYPLKNFKDITSLSVK